MLAQAIKDLEIQFDLFTRTSTDNHRQVVQDLFQRLLDNGHLETRVQRVPYCAQCKRFLPDRFVLGTCPHCRYTEARGDQCESCGAPLRSDLVNPTCKICGRTPVLKTTRHWFFKLDRYKD